MLGHTNVWRSMAAATAAAAALKAVRPNTLAVQELESIASGSRPTQRLTQRLYFIVAHGREHRQQLANTEFLFCGHGRVCV